MNRRTFFRAIGGALIAAAVPWQRLRTLPTRIFQKKIMGRIYITEEVLRDSQPGDFQAYIRAERQALIDDIARREHIMFVGEDSHGA